eukprot:MONOS_396.1-p1 / transcript=MONOS_396.1 / gene=MONOS_396 / organism=Monocercomonoides_exilis_PA203 / gene_product=unspecified product / transcript_product=unspecified product / location=Mono_scaffold00006:218665-220029(-) / protein_length=455 / sequence_SO=supercontig / SO=protein_coding / is_pseudo=false
MIKQWLAADAEWKRSTMGMQNNSRIDVLPSLTFDSNELNPLQPTYIVIHTALNEQELKDGTQLHHHLSSQQKLTSKRRMEIKRQIEQAKQYQKLFDVWIRKEWIENEEEKMMWDKAEEKQERGKIQHEENIDKWAFGELTLEELEKQLADTTEGEAGSGEDLQLLLKQIKIKQKEMERQKQLTELSDWQRVRVIFAKENEKEKKKEERTNRALLEKSEEMNKDNSLRKDADEVIQEPNEEKEIHYEQVSAHSAVQHSNTKIYDFGDLFIGSSLLSPFDRTNSSSHSVSNKPPFELSILHSTPTSNHFAPAVTQRNFISGFRDDCSLQQRKMPHYVHFQSASSLSHDSLNYNFSDPFNVVSYAQSSFYSIDPICINTDLCEIDNFTTESAVLDTDEYLKRFNDPFYNPRLMKKLRHWGKKTNQVARQMEVLISEMENIAPIIFPFCLKRKYQRKR